MWSAGTTSGTPPLLLSLQGTRHHLNNFIPELLAATSKQCHLIYRTLPLFHHFKQKKIGTSYLM